ncbi:hypothetical protein QJQ45_010014 [Haematococcus lacustris]|nr:hypothetical protein QJQ45_010014 [Haematococcus lacustris]
MGRGGEDGEPADQPPSASVGAVEAVTQTASSRVSSRFRTEDVQANKRFQDLALPDRMVTALHRCGFFQPSPVQESAIPLGLLGSDLIVQAKSGTGKTLVFSIICLSRLKRGSSATQALILAPTREVAIQSEQVITRLAAQLYDLDLSQPTASSSLALQATKIPPPSLAAADASCTAAAGPGAGSPTGAGAGAGGGVCSPVTVACFVGGLPVAGDEKKLRRSCQVVVGTPGRLVQLVGSGVLACESVSMLVLDEADALLGDSFYCDVTWLYDNLPRKKQVVACSATFTPDLLADLEPLMKRPQRVMMCEEEEKVSLKGVRQFYHLLTPEQSTATAASTATTTSPAASTVTSGSPGGVDEREELQRKVAVLMQLLTSCSFHQAAVFCNNKPQGEWLARLLTSRGLPAAFLAAGVAQEERGAIMAAMRAFKLRLVVSTDVLARGVDLERVNLVVNLDLPRDAATYVHRVGRTGRFGTRGVSVTLLTSPLQLTQLTTWLAEVGGGSMQPLPPGAALPPDLYAYELKEEWEQEALQQLHSAPQLPAPDMPVKAGAGGQAQSPEHAKGTEPSPLPAPAPAPVPTPPLACGYAPGPSTSWPPLISQAWGGWAQAGRQQQLPQHQQEALQRYWQLSQLGQQPQQHWWQQHQQQQLVHNPGFEFSPLPQQHLQQLGQQKQSLPPRQLQPLAAEQSQAMPPAQNHSTTMYPSALQGPGQQQGLQAGVAAAAAAAAGGSLLGSGPAPSGAAGAAAAGEQGQGCMQQGSHGAAGAAADQAGVAGTSSAQEWAAWAALSPEQQWESWAAWTAWEQQQQQQQEQDQHAAWQQYWVQTQQLQQRYGQHQQQHHHHTESDLPLHQHPHGAEQGQQPQQPAAVEQLPSQAPNPQAPTAPVSGQQAQPSMPDGSGSYPEAKRSAPAPCATDGSDTVRVPDGALAGSVTSVSAASDVPSDDDLDGHAAALLEGLQVKL